MSDFDDFDHCQISWKFAKRKHFIFAFHGKILFSLGNLDDTKPPNETFLRITQYHVVPWKSLPLLFYHSYAMITPVTQLSSLASGDKNYESYRARDMKF